MEEDPKKSLELYEELKESGSKVSDKNVAAPDSSYDKEALRIYSQAYAHRDSLIQLYITYTVGFSLFIGVLVLIQAWHRIHGSNPGFEVMPQWTLNILVTGMFAQFLSLLMVVTNRVWDIKGLLGHANDTKQSPNRQSKDDTYVKLFKK